MGDTPSREIEHLSCDNPIVHELLHWYTRGDLSYVEALERMVVALARVNDEQQKQAIKALDVCTVPTVLTYWTRRDV